MVRSLLLLALLCGAPVILAEPTDNGGHGYTLHYNALPSGMLAEDMARQHGVLRSRGTGVLIVSVHAEGEGSVPAHIEAQATDARNQPVEVSWRVVRVGEHISYLGTFRIRDDESLRFTLSVTPRGSDVTLREQFRQSFGE